MNNDFSILKRKISGYRLVYLDSTNTSLTPISVVKAMDDYYHGYRANIHRAVYPLSEEATAAYEGAREKVRAFIGAKTVREIIFTRNATEAINLVAQSWGRVNLGKSDIVVLSLMEHHSNIVPWQLLQQEKKFQIVYLSVTKEGKLDLAELKKVLKTEKVKLISLVHQSNVLGTINPVKEIVRLGHHSGAKVLIDGAQAAAHFPVNVSKIDADFYIFTGHKMLGPTGIGVLYGQEKLLEAMHPFLGGGDMIRSVRTEGSTWNDLPHKFEAGTPNIAGAIGLGAAIDYLNQRGMKKIYAQEKKLLTYALKKMKNIPEIRILGPASAKDRGSVIAFHLPAIHPHDLATLLGERGICVRAGNHCAQPLHDFLGLSATTRASLYLYNSHRDIDALVKGIREVQNIFSPQKGLRSPRGK